MNLNNGPDRLALAMLDHASRDLPADVPYLIAVQVPDPLQQHGVATHMVTSMQPAEAERALLDLLERVRKQDWLMVQDMPG